MAYVHTAFAPAALVLPEKAPRKTRGLLQRLIEAIEQANMRRAEREVARYLASTGGKLTDDVERQIERRFLRQ